jgi:hypothetical protein
MRARVLICSSWPRFRGGACAGLGHDHDADEGQVAAGLFAGVLLADRS